MTLDPVLTRAEDESALLDAACRLAVEATPARLAWVGRPDEEGRLSPLVSVGESGALAGLTFGVSSPGDEGWEAPHRAWREDVPQYDSSPAAKEDALPSSVELSHLGLGTVAVLPVHRDGSVWALAFFHAPVAFDRSHQRFLEECAAGSDDLVHR